MPQASLGRISNGATGAANSKYRLWVPKWFLAGGTAPNTAGSAPETEGEYTPEGESEPTDGSVTFERTTTVTVSQEEKQHGTTTPQS